jgi:very-short-patch-repair endonuclease
VYSRVAGVGCPHCAKELQSSFPEKAIYFYIKKTFPDAIANYRSDQLNTFELDVFIPSLQIGVEYDGDRWHRSVEKDLQKNALCAEMGIVLIRIREPNCPILSDNLSICIHRESKKTGLEKTIKGLLEKLSEICNVNFSIDVDLERDNAAILELLTSLEKKNNFQLQHPKLAGEWNYQKNGVLLPSMVTSGSDKKTWWVCSQGHSYQASIASRVRGNGCPICSGNKVLKGYNDLQTVNPALSEEWDFKKNIGLSPSDVMPNSDKKVWWKCKNGHEWQARIGNRNRGNSCPECAKEKRKKAK